MLTHKAVCVCYREEVGAGFERTESERESNRVASGPQDTASWHTQNGAEPRVASRKVETKTPNRRGLGVKGWWRSRDRIQTISPNE